MRSDNAVSLCSDYLSLLVSNCFPFCDRTILTISCTSWLNLENELFSHLSCFISSNSKFTSFVLFSSLFLRYLLSACNSIDKIFSTQGMNVQTLFWIEFVCCFLRLCLSYHSWIVRNLFFGGHYQQNTWLFAKFHDF